MSLSSTKRIWRKGKWTEEEEQYADKIVLAFHAGVLDIPPGTTLRSALSELLNCDPMRITKKFSGSCIGKQPFQPAGKTEINSPELIELKIDLERAKKEFNAMIERSSELQNSNLLFNSFPYSHLLPILIETGERDRDRESTGTGTGTGNYHALLHQHAIASLSMGSLSSSSSSPSPYHSVPTPLPPPPSFPSLSSSLSSSETEKELFLDSEMKSYHHPPHHLLQSRRDSVPVSSHSYSLPSSVPSSHPSHSHQSQYYHSHQSQSPQFSSVPGIGIQSFSQPSHRYRDAEWGIPTRYDQTNIPSRLALLFYSNSFTSSNTTNRPYIYLPPRYSSTPPCQPYLPVDPLTSAPIISGYPIQSSTLPPVDPLSFSTQHQLQQRTQIRESSSSSSSSQSIWPHIRLYDSSYSQCSYPPIPQVSIPLEQSQYQSLSNSSSGLFHISQSPHSNSFQYQYSSQSSPLVSHHQTLAQKSRSSEINNSISHSSSSSSLPFSSSSSSLSSQNSSSQLSTRLTNEKKRKEMES